MVGPICETGDFLARDRELADVRPGEYLAVASAGAYGFVQASNYNSRPRAAEVLVDGAQWRIIRERESYDGPYKRRNRMSEQSTLATLWENSFRPNPYRPETAPDILRSLQRRPRGCVKP